MASSEYGSVYSEGLKEHLGLEYKELSRQSDRIFHTDRTNSRYIDKMTWELYGRPQQRKPGATYGPASFKESFGIHVVVVGYGLMDSIPIEDIRDDRYGVINRLLPQKGGAMARAFNVNEELVCAEYMQNAYAAAATTTGLATFDGCGLFSTVHPVSKSQSSTTIANRPSTEVDLSIAGADAAQTNLWTQYAANYVEILDNAIDMAVYHPSQHRIAWQVFKTDWERDNSDRNVNVMPSYGVTLMRWAYFQKSGATGTNNAWFVVGKTHHLNKVVREDVEMDQDKDIVSRSLIVTADHRFAVYADDFRGTYGSVGA